MPMKTTSPALFFLAFAFAFALTTALGRSIAARDVEPLFDTDGNPVINGGLYRILPAPPANAGGFVPVSLEEETCPISVVQASPGLGFTMFIQLSNKVADYVYPSDSVDIIFAGKPVCTDSAKWIVKFHTPVPAVFIGEEDDRTVAGHFGFEKYEDAYKIVFYPERLAGITWSLGISPFGNNRLVTNEENPVKIVLQSFNRGKFASII